MAGGKVDWIATTDAWTLDTRDGSKTWRKLPPLPRAVHDAETVSTCLALRRAPRTYGIWVEAPLPPWRPTGTHLHRPPQPVRVKRRNTPFLPW